MAFARVTLALACGFAVAAVLSVLPWGGHGEGACAIVTALPGGGGVWLFLATYAAVSALVAYAVDRRIGRWRGGWGRRGSALVAAASVVPVAVVAWGGIVFYC